VTVLCVFEAAIATIWRIKTFEILVEAPISV